MAAGMLLDREKFEQFSYAFDEQVRYFLSPDDLQKVIHSDVELKAGDIGLLLAQPIRSAGLWGQSFSGPVFDGEFELVQNVLWVRSISK